MSINWVRADEAERYFTSLQVELLQKVGRLGSESGWTRVLALPVGLSLVAIETVKVISRIGESIFKGLVNTFGSFIDSSMDLRAFASRYDTHRGLMMLAGGPFAAVIEGSINCIASLTIHTVATLLFPNTPCVKRGNPEGFIVP